MKKDKKDNTMTEREQFESIMGATLELADGTSFADVASAFDPEVYSLADFVFDVMNLIGMCERYPETARKVKTRFLMVEPNPDKCKIVQMVFDSAVGSNGKDEDLEREVAEEYLNMLEVVEHVLDEANYSIDEVFSATCVLIRYFSKNSQGKFAEEHKHIMDLLTRLSNFIYDSQQK